MSRKPYLRARVLERDHGKCAECGLDTVALLEKLARKQVKPTWLPKDFDPAKVTPLGWKFLALEYTLELWGMVKGSRKSLWDADHRIALAIGGEDELHNLVTLCLRCHKRKTTFHDVPRIAKSRRQRKKFDAHREKMAAKFPFERNQ